jgi:O-acetylserine/cysteine efflux transporter
MKLYDIALAILICALWGINFVAIKIGVTYFPPLFLMAFRFLLVALILLPWTLKMPRQKMGHMFLLALSMGLYFGILFMGMRGTPAGETTIVIQLQVPFAALMAMYFFKERLSQQTCVGMVIALLGVIVTVGIPDHWGSMTSVGLVIMAALIWGLYNNQMKMVPKMHPFALNGFVALVTFPLFFLVSLPTEHPTFALFTHAPWQAYAGIAFFVLVSTVFCYSAWYHLVGKYPVHKVMPFVLLEPPFGILASTIITGEQIHVHTIVGGILCAIGLALIIIQRKRVHG